MDRLLKIHSLLLLRRDFLSQMTVKFHMHENNQLPVLGAI